MKSLSLAQSAHIFETSELLAESFQKQFQKHRKDLVTYVGNNFLVLSYVLQFSRHCSHSSAPKYLKNKTEAQIWSSSERIYKKPEKTQFSVSGEEVPPLFFAGVMENDWEKPTLYLCTGKSVFFGGFQCIVTLILLSCISVSPSVKFIGGEGATGSEKRENVTS